MDLTVSDINEASKLISQQVEYVTCLECLKYYTSPETAPCGHTLCHTCWRWQSSCPTCTAPLDKKKLRANTVIQNLTRHLSSLVESFEKLINKNLNELLNEMESDTSPNKNVNDWLTSSQNHFSAPPPNSQEILEAGDLLTSKIHIHTDSKSLTPKKRKSKCDVNISSSPAKIPPQEDWDKIEIIPSTERVNNENEGKENILATKSINPIFVDDNYTIQNPRRSSRKKENDDYNCNTNEVILNKRNYKTSTDKIDKKTLKVKNDWNNVKKMRKEFSKLNKINRNKLNVSIEMCKKAQSTAKKNIVTVKDNKSYKSSSITSNDNIEITATVDNKTNKNNDVEQDNVENKTNKNNDVEQDNRTEQSNDEVLKVDNINDKNNSINANHFDISTPKNINEEISYIHNSAKDKIPFFKKSSLDNNYYATVANDNTNNGMSSVNNATSSNSDDIFISIKIGNTMTNITIQKKQNNVQVKVNTDQETQTSLDQNLLKKDEAVLPLKNTVHIGSINNVTTQTSTINKEITKNDKIQQVQTILDKSVSTKKQTASADTATVQFEITESVEKELSSIMECDMSNDAHCVQPQQQAIKGGNMDVDMCTMTQRTEYLNDLDIFEYGSVKEKMLSQEPQVQLLTNTEKAPSEIIMSSIKSSKHKTLKTAEKRNRDIIATNHELPQAKKQKNCNTSKDLVKEIEQDEPINYDAIMGQVFANIDSDIEDIKQSQISNKNANILKQTSNTGYNSQKISDDVSSKTQCVNKVQHNSSEIEANKDKYSENVFSILAKEDESHDLVPEQKNTDIEINETPVQKEINKILTPNIRRDLTEEHADVPAADVDFCTPMQDEDSDKSVVEETPQKTSSFAKQILKNDTNSKTTEKSNANTKNLTEVKDKSSDSQIIKSIINLTDSIVETKETVKDVTIIEAKTCETPLTINKFVDQIQHKSTPVARKSLAYNDIDPDQTLCSTTSQLVKTTQEKEFMAKAFEQTPQTQMRRPLSVKNFRREENRKLCIAGSCLSAAEIARIKALCKARDWTYIDKYVKELTHLVVSVDEENKAQRSVKYMCALAAGKWILNYAWITKCLQSDNIVNEEPYEVLDCTGDPGPRLSRTAQKKLFEGISFFCMPPYTILNVETLKEMLEAAGGTTLSSAAAARVTADSPRPALVLAEPENTQENRFTYLAMELNIVPVNYEWALNCLGGYNLESIQELLLCPSTLLPAATSQWPDCLVARDSI